METETRDWTLQPTAGHETHGQSVICDGDGRSIAIVYDGDRDGRLIAAAPDLLEACREANRMFADISGLLPDSAFEQEWGDVNGMRDTLEAAIAKATKQD